MALFTVITQLQLSTQDRARFERIAVALEAVAAKVTEPEPPPADEAALQQQVDEVVAKLNAANDRLEAAGHPPVA